MSSLRRFLPDGFVLVMLCAVALALLVPWLGTSDGPLKLGMVTKIGIGLVFFLHGANLSLQALASGLGKWKLHLLVQGTTFVMFPLLGLGIMAAGNAAGLPHILLIGLFYLCALPSTVSSSVALTAMAKGNVPAAIFNATISGIIGLFVTPALMALVIGQGSDHALPLGEAIRDIALMLLAPFVAGQLLRPLIGGFIARHKKFIGKIDRGVIVLIVFSAFSDSTAAGTWSQFSIGLLALTIALVLAILFIALLGTTQIARLLGFDRADEVAAVFCGSKKSLANGAPMASVLFAGMAGIGIIMLPIMLYHQAQLIVCAMLARRYAERAGG